MSTKKRIVDVALVFSSVPAIGQFGNACSEEVAASLTKAIENGYYIQSCTGNSMQGYCWTLIKNVEASE